MHVDEIYIGSEFALGDAIVWNPIVHKLAEECNILYHPSAKHNLETMKCLYQDYKKIIVLEQNEYEEKRRATINYGKWDKSYTHIKLVPLKPLNVPFFLCNVNWERQIYEHFDLPYSFRYTGFKLPKYVDGAQELYEKLTNGCKEYVVVNKYIGHFNEELKFNVEAHTKGLKVIEINPWITNNMLQYIELFRNAKQIHTPGTATFCLLESMKYELNADLYFHDLRRNYVAFLDSDRWKVIKYHDMYKTHS